MLTSSQTARLSGLMSEALETIDRQEEERRAADQKITDSVIQSIETAVEEIPMYHAKGRDRILACVVNGGTGRPATPEDAARDSIFRAIMQEMKWKWAEKYIPAEPDEREAHVEYYIIFRDK